MKDTALLFARITAALEDMHTVAVEGQKQDATTDECWVLLASLREGVRSVSRSLAEAAATLHAE